MSTDPLFDSLVDDAYERIYCQSERADSVIASLVDAGNNRHAAEMVVQMAIERHKEEDRFDNLGFCAWVQEMIYGADLSRSGWGVGLLALGSAIGAGFALHWVTQRYDLGEWRGEAYVGIAAASGVLLFVVGSVFLYVLWHHRSFERSRRRPTVVVPDVIEIPEEGPLYVPGMPTYNPDTDYQGDWDWDCDGPSI